MAMLKASAVVSVIGMHDPLIQAPLIYATSHLSAVY